jgi:16S rRNA (adenine1518-N6/adenine1519-N6)-dimethyltransferase
MENPYITPARVRAALRSLELRPTREMGQNFLVDADALAAIVTAAELTRDDVVVEVGPGLGVLTWELLARAGHVVAVELDKRLAERLGHELGADARLEGIQGDILKLPPEHLLVDQRPKTKDQTIDSRPEDSSLVLGPSSLVAPPYKVVANLPYAITSAVLRHFLEAQAKPELMVVLVQWEVAKRITARPGDLSVLAHSVQIYAEPEIVARVPAASFVPTPAVDSAVLRLRAHPHPAVDVDVDALMRVIKAGFLQARKKLSNALPTGLAAMGVKIDKGRTLAALAAAGVDPGRRAETVTLEEWVRIYRVLRA